MAGRRPPRGAGEGLLCPTPRPKSVLALDDMIAPLVELDANGLCLQWRNHLGGTPPAHLPRWLLMKILAYRIQATAFGGLDKETLRVLRQPKGRRLASSDLHPFQARSATTRETATLRRVEGAQAAGMGDGGQVILAGARVSTGLDAWIAEAGAYRFFAGWRSDPFFFDVQGMLNNQQFSGADVFADKNVCSIVLESPNSDLGRKRLGLWARTRATRAAAGSRRTAARCPRKLSSSLEGKETPTWQVNLRMTTASFLSSRTRSSTAAGIRPRKQGG